MDDDCMERAAPAHVTVESTTAGVGDTFPAGSRVVGLALVLALGFSVLIAWGMNFSNVDLMLGLAAGRDVADGLVGQPDHWSFAGGDSVWIDQGWLSHFVYYASYAAFAQWGPVLLKGLLLLCCLGALFFRCRGLGVSVNVSILALICGCLGASTFLSIRAENFGLLSFVLLSTFLVAPLSWGLIRQVGCVATLLVWGNAHGSFVLGLVLVGARIVLALVQWAVARRALRTPQGGGAGYGSLKANPLFDAAAWAATAILCVAGTAFVNPFGSGNLRVPVHQVLYGTQTVLNPDWLPLLDWPSLTEIRFFYPLDVMPFLLELGVVLTVALALVVLSGGPRSAFRILSERAEAARNLIGMETLIALITVSMAFSLRRAALFAGLGLVPLLGFLLQSALQVLVAGNKSRLAALSCRFRGRFAAIAAVTVMALTGWIFSTRTLLPYLPGNPFLPDGPPTSRFLDFDWAYANLATFMNDNGITGRVFCSWELEGYLIFHVPGVKVLAGTRAQSFYSPETIEDYRKIQLTRSRDRESVLSTLGLLDTYEVDVVVLRREPAYLPLELALTLSAEWANVYRDSWATVMIRSGSERCRSLLAEGGLASLAYPDPRARIIAEAYLDQFVRGWVPDDKVDSLKKLVADVPVPDAYWLLGYRGTGRNRCLESDTLAYFRSEVERLSRMDFMTAEGAHSILGSLLTLTTFLEMDERSCSRRQGSDEFGEARLRLGAMRDSLEKRYMGRCEERI
jgi:hypothetical protein